MHKEEERKRLGQSKEPNGEVLKQFHSLECRIRVAAIITSIQNFTKDLSKHDKTKEKGHMGQVSFLSLYVSNKESNF